MVEGDPLSVYLQAVYWNRRAGLTGGAVVKVRFEETLTITIACLIFLTNAHVVALGAAASFRKEAGRRNIR
jgi:hypothetical protein